MKNQKLKIGIFCAAIAVFFYLLGSFIGWPAQNDMLSGDIGKAKKTSSTVVKIDRDALQEKMLSDTAYCQKTLATVGMMQLHAKQFGALLVMTDAVAKDEKALQSSLEEMQKVKETVKNATVAIDIFADDMVRLSKGEKVNGFEQDYNNAMLGFSMLQRCSNVAVDFAQNVRDSLSLLAEANKKDIETIYTEWVTFAYVDAVMSQDQLRCGHIEQLFMNNSEDQLGLYIPQVSHTGKLSTGEQLGENFVEIKLNQVYRTEQLSLAWVSNAEQLEEASHITNVPNAEQLKSYYRDAQQLNGVIIVEISNNSENNLGTVASLKSYNSTDLPCVEMLDVYLHANQDNLQWWCGIGDKDVLGVMVDVLVE